MPLNHCFPRLLLLFADQALFLPLLLAVVCIWDDDATQQTFGPLLLRPQFTAFTPLRHVTKHVPVCGHVERTVRFVYRHDAGNRTHHCNHHCNHWQQHQQRPVSFSATHFVCNDRHVFLFGISCQRPGRNAHVQRNNQHFIWPLPFFFSSIDIALR